MADEIDFGGKTLKNATLDATISGGDTSTWKGDYNSLANYSLGDYVVYNGQLYGALQSSYGNTPSESPSQWALIGNSTNTWKGEWNSNTMYNAGDYVVYSSQIYVSTQMQSMNTPMVGSSFWSAIGSGGSSLPSGPITDGYVLTWSGWSNQWQAAAPSGGTVPNPTGTNQALISDSMGYSWTAATAPWILDPYGSQGFAGSPNNGATLAYSTSTNRWEISSGGGSGPYTAGTGAASIVGSGSGNAASGNYSVVSGGYSNTASGYFSAVGGGKSNTVFSGYNYGTIGGGFGNAVMGEANTIGGGQYNSASAYNYVTIGGGKSNTGSGNYVTIGGGKSNTASGYASTVSGGVGNTASNWYSAVGGGKSNTASASYSAVSGGRNNTASAYYSTVAGGYHNTASANKSTVGGGQNNAASGNNSTASGGAGNTASGQYSTVGGGVGNTASGDYSTVSGGIQNTASGNQSTVGGGFLNTASGNYSSVLGGFSNNTNGYSNSHIIGSNITADAADTTYVNNLKFAGNGAGVGGLLTNAIFKTYREVTNAPTIASNALTLDLSLAQVFNVALNDNITTLTISNTPADANTATGFTLIFTADGTARSVTWPSSITWYSGSAPSLPTTNGAKAILTFLTTDNGTTWYGF